MPRSVGKEAAEPSMNIYKLRRSFRQLDYVGISADKTHKIVATVAAAVNGIEFE